MTMATIRQQLFETGLFKDKSGELDTAMQRIVAQNRRALGLPPQQA